MSGGEGAKNSGEAGEKIASSLLDKIGWTLSMHNISIPCNNPTHLNDNKKQRKTHGEDQIFVYNTPFHDDVTEIVHVSVKNTNNKYPAGEQGLKTKTKKFIEELHEIIECAKYSEQLAAIEENANTKKHKNHVGLLIFLSSDSEDLERNIRPNLSRIRLENSSSTPIYLIDNARASFLLKVVDHLQSVTAENEKYEFYYPNIGTAVSVEAERRGPYLPLGLIASDIVVAIVDRGEWDELYLYSDESYDSDSYQKLIGYSLGCSNSLVRKIHIGMAKFNPTKDMDNAKKVRLAFQDRREEIKPFSIKRSILDLAQEQ